MVLYLAVFAAEAKDTKSREAKYIILMIGDGMNIEHEIAASRYLYGKDFKLSFHKLPYQANVATWDVTTYNYWSGGSMTQTPSILNMDMTPQSEGKNHIHLGLNFSEQSPTTLRRQRTRLLLRRPGPPATKRMMAISLG